MLFVLIVTWPKADTEPVEIITVGDWDPTKHATPHVSIFNPILAHKQIQAFYYKADGLLQICAKCPGRICRVFEKSDGPRNMYIWIHNSRAIIDY